MSHRVKSVSIIILLAGLAVLLTACGSAEGDDAARVMPTLAEREPTQIAAVPTARTLPTLAPEPQLPVQQPQVDAGDTARPLTENLDTTDAVPAFPEPATADTDNAALPPPTTGDPFSPPVIGDQQEDDEATDSDALPFMELNSPPTGEDGNVDGGENEAPASDAPFGDPGSVPFGGGPPTDAGSGGSDGAPDNSAPPFDLNPDMQEGGDPFGGGGNDPFGGGGGGDDPFGGGGGFPGGDTPFADIGGSRWYINGEQPISVLACPETTCELLGTLDAGDSVQLAGDDGSNSPDDSDDEPAIDPEADWVAITFNNDIAYIFSAFVSEREQSEIDSGGFPGGGDLPFDPNEFVGGGPPGGGPPGVGDLPFDPGGGGPPGVDGGGPPGFDGGPPFGNPTTSNPQNGVINSGGTFSTTTGFGSGSTNPLYTAPENPGNGFPPGGGGPPGGGDDCPPFLPNC